MFEWIMDLVVICLTGIIAVLVLGCILWLIDALILAPIRENALERFVKKNYKKYTDIQNKDDTIFFTDTNHIVFSKDKSIHVSEIKKSTICK